MWRTLYGLAHKLKLSCQAVFWFELQIQYSYTDQFLVKAFPKNNTGNDYITEVLLNWLKPVRFIERNLDGAFTK